jgi:hypothetical protein
MQPVKAASDIRESEIADEALSNATGLERGESGVLGRDLAAVEEREAAKIERVSLVAAESSEVYVELLREDHCCVVLVSIRHIVVGTEAESSLRRGSGRIRGQPKQKRHREFGIPIPGFEAFGKAKSQKIPGVLV